MITPQPQLPHLRLPRARIAVVLWVLVGLLCVGSLGSQILKYEHGIDWGMGLLPKMFLDAEDGFGTFFATGLLLSCALLLWMSAGRARVEDRPFVKHWAFLALLFLGMAMDEAVGLHELLIPILRDRLGTSGLLHYAWVIVGAGAVLLVGLAYIKFLLHLERATRMRFIIAAILYVGGALGIELFEGQHVSEHGIHNLTYGIYVTIEETAELAGLTVFALALLRHLAASPSEVRIAVSSGEAM